MRGPVNTSGVFDIILGDFGRLASIDYVKYLSEEERQEILGDRKSNFFDEERLIMFNLCCQIGWYKRDAISKQIQMKGSVDRNILIGIGPESVASEFLERGAETIRANIELAMIMGFEKIRVYTPCNGLSDLVREATSSAFQALKGTENKVTIHTKEGSKSSNQAVIEFCSVPEKVVRRVVREGRSHTVLVLGTLGVNEIYKREVAGTGVTVFPLNDEDFDLLDDAIVASIGKGQDSLMSAKILLEESIVSRFRSKFPDGVVIEACTDFDFGIGDSSLKIFAEEMVLDVYRN